MYSRGWSTSGFGNFLESTVDHNPQDLTTTHPFKSLHCSVLCGRKNSLSYYLDVFSGLPSVLTCHLLREVKGCYWRLCCEALGFVLAHITWIHTSDPTVCNLVSFQLTYSPFHIHKTLRFLILHNRLGSSTLNISCRVRKWDMHTVRWLC